MTEKMQDELIEGRWYWVRLGGGNPWFPAERCAESTHGWYDGSVMDWWGEDITEWILIPPAEMLWERTHNDN